MGSTRRQADNLTVGRLELIASDLLRGAAAGSFVLSDPNRTSAFLNVRVADIARVYQEWSAKGAEFLTEPKDHGQEIRAYIRDPDGHLIEVGQSTGILR